MSTDHATTSTPTRKTGVQARPVPVTGPFTAVADGWTVARRNLIKIKRVPDLLVGSIVSPIMFILLFAYVFGGAIDTEGGGAGYLSLIHI